jgi:Tol biopolymer transport system component
MQRPDKGVFSILETLRVDTGERVVLEEFEDTIEAPNWTRNGRYLVYNRRGRIYRYELSTHYETDIYAGELRSINNDHVLSPGGALIGVSCASPEDGLSRISVLPLAGGAPKLITPLAPSYLHGWSPDGATLAYCAKRGDSYDVYTIPAGGGQEKQLTSGSGLNDGPEYSPDGRYLWFNSSRTGLMQLWRMEADGSNQTQMTFDEANSWFPHLSPDGTRVAYISYQKGDVAPNEHPPNKQVQLRLMSAGGGDYEVGAELFGGQGTMNVNSWSPDSQTLAFVSYRLK